ncbi:MAG: hypothetical protein JSW59_02530, partial [Phycisphaerales bacterium]
MSACSNRLNCKSAQLCYYDLLDAETAGSVPKEVHEHIASCADCQSDMNQLRELLASADNNPDNEQHSRDKAVIELLSLHFAWAGRPVRCTEAKPFLPSLADPLLQIRQQTPITVHVENCRPCSEELSALTESGLSHKQLCRMSSMLAEDPDADAESPELRAVMPMVTGIMERPDSEITTLFTLGKPDDKAGLDAPDESYAFRPIKVEVIGTDTEASERKQMASVISLKRFLKPLIAAAAVILIGFAVFFRAPAVKAVGPEQIYIAIVGADNIHVSQFMPGKTEAVQEKWVSRSRGIYMTRTGQKLVLWDIANGLRKSKDTVDGVTKVETLTEKDSASIKQKINGTLGITPSTNISDLPPETKWNRVADNTIEPEVQDCEVYDLTWSGGKTVLKRWRCFVESASG